MKSRPVTVLTLTPVTESDLTPCPDRTESDQVEGQNSLAHTVPANNMIMLIQHFLIDCVRRGGGCLYIFLGVGTQSVLVFQVHLAKE